MSIDKITRTPIPRNANKYLFWAFGWGLVTYWFFPLGFAYWWEWAVVAYFAGVTIHCARLGITLLVADYHLRCRRNLIVQSVAEDDTPTFEQRKAMGLYNPENGALLGWDMEHNLPLFLPSHINVQWIQGGIGSGKTSRRTVPSIPLMAVFQRR